MPLQSASRNRERIADGPRPLPPGVIRRCLFEHVLVNDESTAVAMRTRRGERLYQALRHTLSRHLHEAELRDREHLGAGLVAGQRLAERLFHGLAVVADLHVDEVDDDDAADI